MLIYEYHCAKCDAVSEFLEPVNSRNKHVCPRCGSKRIEKILSTFSARFGGGGSEPARARSACTSCRRSSCASCKR